MHRLLSFLGLTASLLSAGADAQEPPGLARHPVLELRQYKLTQGSEGRFIALFDREFVETQEQLGMRIIGQFHDHDRPDRFTWFRDFPDMSARAQMLRTFYTGPVWMKHRGTANPMLDDNDNVLLLRPARLDTGFGTSLPRPTADHSKRNAATYFAVIEYLWKDPTEGFVDIFLNRLRPALERGGLPVLGVYVPEEEPNNFPRLPVRPDRKILVWFTRGKHADDYAVLRKRLEASPIWKRELGGLLADAEERLPQVLRLAPTPRSALQ